MSILEEIEESLRVEPLDYDANCRLASYYSNRRQFAKAVEVAGLCIRINSGRHEGWVELANALTGLGNRWSCVRKAAMRALEIAPNHPGAHWLLASARMFGGEWMEAWKSYEYGFLCGRRLQRCMAPTWDGRPLDTGETLLIHSEQGHGDTIQHLRFLIDAKKRAGSGRITLECQTGLMRLAQDMGVAVEVIAQPRDRWLRESPTVHAPLMSLPHILGLGSEDIDRQPYIFAEPQREFDQRVGFVWQGSRSHPNDARRSLTPSLAKAIGKIDVPWLAMQGALEEPPFDMASAAHHMTDFKGTAEVVASVKALVSVDTSTAHLAGAMGIPVVLIAPEDYTEPRWGKERLTPWYRSMRIVHRQGRGTESDSEVATKVEEALIELASH